MKIHRRMLSILGLLITCLLVSDFAQAQISSIGSAINKAGRQRMLTQRIVATYCQVGMNIKTKRSQQQLEDSISLFEQQLAELKNYRPQGRIHNQLQIVTELWQPMKKIASEPVDRNRAADLRNLAEDTLRASHRVVVMLEDEAGTPAGRLVNMAGRQRMLSQRMSNLYMLQAWGFSSADYSSDYSRAINEFKGALLELKSSKLNTAEINRGLNDVRKQFAILERSLNQQDGDFIPLMVKLSADKLLVKMNDVTHQYEELSRKK